MVSAYDVLRKACGFSGPMPSRNCDYIRSALFLNWKRARHMNVPEDISDDELWKLFFKVGFSSGIVLPLADGGIRPLIKRILDLHWLTDECCSGHAGEFRTNPHIGIIFPDDNVRERFVMLCKSFFAENAFDLEMTGDTEDNDPFGNYREKYTEISSPYGWFYKRRMTTFFWFTSTCDEETQKIWHTFSAVLNVYDKKGLYFPLLSSLRLSDSTDEALRMLEKMYTKLCRE